MSMPIQGASGAAMPQVVSGASGYAPPAAKMSSLFQAIDADHDGAISQSQFNQAFATMNPPASFQALGAGATFGQLDPAGNGSVSKSDFVSGMVKLMRALRNGTSPATTPAQTLSASLESFQSLNRGGLNVSA